MKKVFQKRYVLLLVLFSQVLAVMFGYYLGERKYQYKDCDSEFFPYTKKIDVGNLTLFTDDNSDNYLLIRRVKQGNDIGYRWIVSEEKDEDGEIRSDYYGPCSQIKLQSPMIGPMGEFSCCVCSENESLKYIACQLGKFPNSNLFMARTTDNLWSIWHDQAADIHYDYDSNTKSWKEREP